MLLARRRLILPTIARLRGTAAIPIFSLPDLVKLDGLSSLQIQSMLYRQERVDAFPDLIHLVFAFARLHLGNRFVPRTLAYQLDYFRVSFH
jgi:hypothetical protein